MATIRDTAVTVYAAVTTNMVMEMPTHETGDLLVAFVNKDTNAAFTTPANWNAIRTVLSSGAAGGVYTKWAASASETVTFALASETCCGIVIAVSGAETEIDSGAGALTINVVAASGTYTRTTGSFTTDGFTVGQTVIMSGFTNAGNNGPKEISTITGSGTIITVTSITGLVNETGNNNERVKSTGLDLSAASGADDITLPFTGIGMTPIANNCLILHGLSADIGFGPNALSPWVNLFAGDTAANSLCVSYSYKPTAGAITAPDHWGGIETGVDCRSVIVAVRDSTSGASKPAYLPLSTAPALQITPLDGTTGNVDKGTYRSAAGIVITSVAGKTVSGVSVATTADSGINPFRGSMRNAGASSTTQLNHVELPLASSVDLTGGEGLLFGTYLNLAPRDYVDTGKAVQGGVYMLAGSSTANWKAWVVGGQFSKTEKPDARNNYLIEVASSDTIYGSAGTANMAAAIEFAFGSAGYYGAPSILWNALYRLGVFVLAGGSSTSPFDFEDLIFTINQGSGILPLMQQSGSVATIWCPIRFGGTENIGVLCNLNTFQFPKKADEIDYVDFHLSADKIGIEFYGTSSSDYMHFTNCVFTSPSAYYWRFNSSHNASADIDFSGSSVVYASVTLRSTVVLDNLTFIQCNEIVLNGADISNSTIQQQRIGANSGGIAFTSATEGNGVTTCAFVNNNDGSLGHSIRITATGTYTFNGHTFSGGGPAKRYFNTGTGVNSGTDIVTVDAAHGYTDGDAIYYQDQGGAQNMGLTDGTLYYVNSQTATTLSFHTSRANAIADTSKVNLTSTGTETHYIYSAKADVYNNSGGAVTIEVSNNGHTPTVRDSNGSSTTVNNVVVLEINGVIQNTQCYIVPVAGGGSLMNESATTLVSGDEYKATENYNFVINTAVTIRARETGYLPFETTGTITNGGLTVTAIWQVDSNWKLVVTGVNITFTNGTSLITRASGNFTTDGWLPVMSQVTVTGSTSNNGTYTITAVGTTTITVSGTLVTEGPVSGVTLTYTRREL